MSAGTLILEAASALVGFAAGALSGLWLGKRYATPPWKFWTLSVGAVFACSGLCAVGLAEGWRWLSLGALGLLLGVLTGAKYGARGGFLPRGE